MKSAIVAGASGFIGRYLVNDLVTNGIQVLTLDRRPSKDISRDTRSVEFKLDSVDRLLMQWTETHGQYDTFYNLAWQGSSGNVRSDTRLQLDNVQWSIDLLRFAKQIGCTRYIGAGSIMEHETIEETLSQGHRPNLAHVYSDAKLAAHLMGKSIAADIGIDFIWAEITNAYGPGERSPRLINSTLRKILRGELLEFTSATQLYDFIFVADAAEALRLIGDKGIPFCEYTLGSGHAKPLRSFIEELVSAFSPVIPPQFGVVPYSGFDLPAEAFSIARLEQDTGFRCRTSFVDGLHQTMMSLKEEG